MKRVFCFASFLDAYSVKRFKEESIKAGFEFQAIDYRKISIDFLDNIKIKYLEKDLIFNSEDLIILRNPKVKEDYDYGLFHILLDYLKSSKAMVINIDCFINFPAGRDKLFQYYFLNKKNFSIIKPTFFPGCDENISKKIKDINFPFIVKPRNSYGGNGIFKIKNEEEFYDKTSDLPAKNTLMQNFIPNNFDLRVICSQDKIIGVMKRTASEGKDINNFSAGGSVENYELKDEKIIEDCLSICKYFNCDYLGIDIVLEKDDYYIFEVNFFCHFEGFEKATKINFPKSIFDLALNKKDV